MQQTTPLMLDRRGAGFITTCKKCASNAAESTGQGTWELPLGWRQLVRRMSALDRQPDEHRCDWSDIRDIPHADAVQLHTGRMSSKRWIRDECERRCDVDVHTRRRWGCMHCPVHIAIPEETPEELPGSWFPKLMGRADLFKHITTEHRKQPEYLTEGVDYFFERGLAGSRDDSDEFQ
ncbi:unnamed protein product [Peniophora sp. CBMAI 1063]|nr:unnamed protein product [Peniophora sp. CBMAI 1063]